MKRVPFRSRAIASAGYDADTRALDVEFSSGRVYRFLAVPSSVYEWLVRVPNKGAFMARIIDGGYAYEEIRPAAEQEADLEALLEASLSDRTNER